MTEQIEEGSPAPHQLPEAPPPLDTTSERFVGGVTLHEGPVETPVPEEVSRRQLWLALNAMGVTRSAVKAQLAGNEAALIELEEAQSYRRDNPLVQMLGASLGLTGAEIDGVFIEAAKL